MHDIPRFTVTTHILFLLERAEYEVVCPTTPKPFWDTTLADLAFVSVNARDVPETLVWWHGRRQHANRLRCKFLRGWIRSRRSPVCYDFFLNSPRNVRLREHVKYGKRFGVRRGKVCWACLENAILVSCMVCDALVDVSRFVCVTSTARTAQEVGVGVLVGLGIQSYCRRRNLNTYAATIGTVTGFVFPRLVRSTTIGGAWLGGVLASSGMRSMVISAMVGTVLREWIAPRFSAFCGVALVHAFRIDL